MPKLHQVIALIPSVKNRATSEITKLHQIHQKPALFEGISRRYQPVNDEGEKLPSESKKLERNVRDSLEQTRRVMSELYDVVALQDKANTEAKADVKVGEKVILNDVPVTHLLFLEKQIKDLETYIKELPTLPEEIDWEKDSQTDSYRSAEYQTVKTAKLQRPLVLYDATKEHPAQVQLITEDKTVGYWFTTKFAGGIEAKNKREMLVRVQQLRDAIVLAREEANAFEVTGKIEEGKHIFDFVFGN